MMKTVDQYTGTSLDELDVRTGLSTVSSYSGILTAYYATLFSDSGVIVPTQPVQVEGNAVRFYPHMMILNRFYSIVFNNRPYAYRRTNEDEVEVYGLAEES